MGDFNLKEINWVNLSTTIVNENHPANKFLETIRDNYLYQHVNKPTRYRDGQVPSLLDLVMTNEEGMIEDMQFLPGLGKSDHCVIVFDFIAYTPNVETVHSRKQYNFFKGKYNNINKDLKDHNWDILDHMDMTKGWDHFTEFIYKVIDKHIPESRVPHPNGRNCPYLSKKARETVRLKHKRWQKYIHCKTEQNLNLYKKGTKQCN